MRKDMRLLIDARKMSYKPSGIGIYIYRYVLGLYQYSKIEMILVTDVEESDEIKELKDKGIAVYCFGKKVDYSLSILHYMKFINNVIKKIGPDIFWEPNNILSGSVKNSTGVVLLTVHDLFPITYPQYHRFLFRLYYKFMMQRSLKNADVITSVSVCTLEELKNKYRKVMKGKRAFVSYNIVDLDYREAKRDEGYFLYIGNVELRKGVDILLKSFCLYRQQGGKLGLYIAGGIRDKNLEEMIKKMSNKYSNFKYLGYVSNEQKEKLLEECTCFVFPSRAEGFGIPPLEALAYGKNVLVSSLPVFHEILGDEVSYFKLKDKETEENVKALTNGMFHYKKKNNHIVSLLARYSSLEVVNNFILKLGRNQWNE